MPDQPKRLTKLTEQELKQRKICIFSDPEGMEHHVANYRLKISTYEEEGVLKSYYSLNRSFCALLMICDTRLAFADKYAAAKCAQLVMDGYLMRRSRGEELPIPAQVFLHEPKKGAKDSHSIELYDADLFEEKGGVSENEKLRWIFENLQLDGIEPSDAPSIGAYTLMMELRTNQQARQKFYDSAWLKLLSKEDAEKAGKLEDTGKKAIELIDRLIAALPALPESD